ncbi:unnamed protein product [Rhizopus microsporus]
MTSIQLNVSAHAIPLLHAAKYPAYSVCGVLLGKVNGSNLHITKAIPFFHHWITLSPMLEVALRQTEIYAHDHKLTIIGWYHANEDKDDTRLSDGTKHVAETIRKQCGHCVVLLINNKVFSQPDEAAFIPHVYTDNQWKVTNQLTIQEAASVKSQELIASSKYKDLHDFDEALEDASLDWLNGFI